MHVLHSIHESSRRQKLERLLRTFRPERTTTLLEVGVGNTEPLPSTNYIIKHYPYRGSITALGLGDMSNFSKLHPDVPVVSYAGKHFPFGDGAFDLVHANAVIEHVGRRDDQLLFLSELLRVARRGMITTPNKYFPIETHTLIPFAHWTTDARFRQRVERIGVSRLERLWAVFGREFPTAELQDLRLLSARELRTLATEAGMREFEVTASTLCGWPFSLVLSWSRH